MNINMKKRVMLCIVIAAAILYPALTMPDLKGFIRDEGPWAFIFLGAIIVADCYLILTPKEKTA